MTKYKALTQTLVSKFLLVELDNIRSYIFFSFPPSFTRTCYPFLFVLPLLSSFLSFHSLNPKWAISRQFFYSNQLPDYPLCCTDCFLPQNPCYVT